MPDDDDDEIRVWDRETQDEFEFEPGRGAEPLGVLQDLDLALTGRRRTEVPSHGATVWDSGILLARALAALAPSLALGAGDSVVELGSGTGIGGMTAARLWPQATVVLTDQEPILPLARRNVAANFDAAGNPPLVCPLQWGDAEHLAALPVPLPPSLVIAADVLYHEAALEPLARTLRALGAPCLVAFCVRSPIVAGFLAGFDVEAVEVEAQPGDDVLPRVLQPGCAPDCVCEGCCDGLRVRVVWLRPLVCQSGAGGGSGAAAGGSGAAGDPEPGGEEAAAE